MDFVVVVVLFALSFAGFVAVRRGVMPRKYVNSTLIHWRKMTWAIVVWLAATVVVFVVGASDPDPYAGAALLTLATMVGSTACAFSPSSGSPLALAALVQFAVETSRRSSRSAGSVAITSPPTSLSSPERQLRHRVRRIVPSHHHRRRFRRRPLADRERRIERSRLQVPWRSRRVAAGSALAAR